jgi:hypothetical protein
LPQRCLGGVGFVRGGGGVPCTMPAGGNAAAC